MINTHDPLTVDIDLANTVNVLDTCTDLSFIIENFPTEVATSNIYNFIRYTSNPIHDEIQFFIDLHNDNLKTKDYRGGINPRVDTKKIKVKNINDQLNYNQRVVVDDDLNYNATGESNPVATVDIYRNIRDDNNELVREDSKASYIPIPLTDLENNKNFKDQVGLSTLHDTRFIIHWLDKFRKAHKHVKDEVIKKLGDKNIFYQEFSDSIGSLSLTEFVNDRSCAKIYNDEPEPRDPSSNKRSTVPEVFPGTVNNLLDEDTRMMIIEMSQKTTAVFRKNIMHLGELYKDRPGEVAVTASHASQPHGVNLVSDTSHYTRIHALKFELETILRDTLKGMYNVLTFIRNSEQSAMIGKPNITRKIEDNIAHVDWLGNNIIKPRAGVAAAVTSGNTRLT